MIQRHNKFNFEYYPPKRKSDRKEEYIKEIKQGESRSS